MLCPRREVSQFSVIPIVSEPHLGADKQYLSVVNDNTAIIYDVLVDHGPASVHSKQRIQNDLHIHANIAHNSLSLLGGQDLGQYLP